MEIITNTFLTTQTSKYLFHPFSIQERCWGLIHRPLWEFQYWGELLRRWPFLSMNFALVRQIHPIMTLHTLETVFWLACVESNVASFMTVRSDLTASYVLIVIKHSSVRSVLILQNRFSRTRIKLDIAFWLTVFRVRVEITKQNKYSKVIWPCGFIPCCFGSSRCQVFFIFRLLFFSMFYWYWFDYLVCDTFCVFPFHIGVLSPYLYSELNGCYESSPPWLRKYKFRRSIAIFMHSSFLL